MSEHVTAERTGQPPLAFRGLLLAEASTWSFNGPNNSRWHVLAVYRTEGGQLVLTIGYHSQWQGEIGQSVAVVVEDAQGLRDALKAYDPLAVVGGYPSGPAYQEKQAKLNKTLAQSFAAAVSDLYRALGSEFAEIVA